MSNHFIKSFTFLYLNLTMSTVDDINNTITIIFYGRCLSEYYDNAKKRLKFAQDKK